MTSLNALRNRAAVVVDDVGEREPRVGEHHRRQRLAAAGHDAFSRAATSASSASAHAAVAAICAKNGARCASLEQTLSRISRSSLSTAMTSSDRPDTARAAAPCRRPAACRS